jgi:penicillin-binding protein 1A
MVVINVETGAIAGMQGGYGEKTVNFGTNRAVDIERQPGSSIKPLIVYAPALEMGILSPATQINDAELHQDDDHPELVWPRNSDGKYEGLITIRKAIVKSKNTVAVQVWKQVQSQGGDMALWFLSQVGIDRMTEVYPATAVGGFNVGMSPLEMAAAYATFANEGVYRVPYAYTKVVDSSGDVILENIPEEHRVYSVETAFLISDILKGVITGGTAYGKVYPITNEAGETIDVAGKTGTTDDNVDKWFCGYTPYYAAATWYGYDNRLRKTEIPKGNDRNSAMYIWNDAMQKIHATLPAATFIRPETVVYKTICSQTQMLATDSCKDKGYAVTDYFDTNKSIPTLTCPGHDPITPVPTVAPPPL